MEGEIGLIFDRIERENLQDLINFDKIICTLKPKYPEQCKFEEIHLPNCTIPINAWMSRQKNYSCCGLKTYELLVHIIKTTPKTNFVPFFLEQLYKGLRDYKLHMRNPDYYFNRIDFLLKNCPNVGKTKIRELFLLALMACGGYNYIGPGYGSSYNFVDFYDKIKTYPSDLVYTDRFCVKFLKIYSKEYKYIPEVYQIKYAKLAIEMNPDNISDVLARMKSSETKEELIQYALKHSQFRALEHPEIPWTFENLSIVSQKIYNASFNRYLLRRSNRFASIINDPSKAEELGDIYNSLVKLKLISLNDIDKRFHNQEMLAIAIQYDQLGYIHHYRESMTAEQWFEVVKYSKHCFVYVPHVFHTDEMINMALEYGMNIEHVPDQTPERCFLAILNYPQCVRKIREPTEEMYLAATKNGLYANELYEYKFITPRIAINAAALNHFNQDNNVHNYGYYYRAYMYYSSIMQSYNPLYFNTAYYRLPQGIDQLSQQVRWWVLRERLFRIGMGLFEITNGNIYQILWIVDQLEFFDEYTEYRKIEVLKVIENFNRGRVRIQPSIPVTTPIELPQIL